MWRVMREGDAVLLSSTECGVRGFLHLQGCEPPVLESASVRVFARPAQSLE